MSSSLPIITPKTRINIFRTITTITCLIDNIQGSLTKLVQCKNNIQINPLDTILNKMSNSSSKSGSSNSQKVFGRSYPDIKITDTSNTTSRGSSLISKTKEDVNVKYTNEPLRIRLEYK